jgi:hypothetical protein
MRRTILSIFLSLALTGLAAALAETTSVTFQVQATHQLPNPYAVPPSTHATLSSFRKTQRTPISLDNSFVFHNVTPGSYLVDIHCATHAFAPLRLDVLVPSPDDSTAQPALTLKAWETYRGNDWDNKGQVAVLRNGVFDVHALGQKNYFMERSKCEYPAFATVGCLFPIGHRGEKYRQ